MSRKEITAASKFLANPAKNLTQDEFKFSGYWDVEFWYLCISVHVVLTSSMHNKHPKAQNMKNNTDPALPVLLPLRHLLNNLLTVKSPANTPFHQRKSGRTTSSIP